MYRCSFHYFRDRLIETCFLHERVLDRAEIMKYWSISNSFILIIIVTIYNCKKKSLNINFNNRFFDKEIALSLIICPIFFRSDFIGLSNWVQTQFLSSVSVSKSKINSHWSFYRFISYVKVGIVFVNFVFNLNLN